MTALTLSTSSAAALRADAVVVGVAKGTKGPEVAPGAEAVDKAYDGKLAATLETLGASGGEGEVTKLPAPEGVKAPVVVVVGLGEPPADGEAYDTETLRAAAGAAARALSGAKKAVFALPTADAEAAGAIAEGALLGAYAYTAYQQKSNGRGPLAEVALVGAKPRDKAYKTAAERAIALATEVNRARDLINMPPNDLHPKEFATVVQAAAKEHGLKVEVLDEKALAKGGYGGILGVGSGSSRLPRLIRLSYKGPKASKKVALVGKGITFDTGGISIKPAANMDEMTSDMSGAAAVIASVILAAKLKYPLEVIATVPIAENMPSGTSYRPGDVLTMYGGKTVEVLNTDAEGRLILADAMVRASEDNPDYLIDTATLTGAQVVALGRRTAGVMGTESFRDRVTEIGQAVGEGSWAMPLPEELRGDLDSRVADMANVTGHRWGGMLAAALFLREFVPEGLDWAHIDVAGPAYNPGSPWGYNTRGGTGVPVRTIAAVMADIAENG